MWGILGAGFGAVFKVVAIIFGGALIWSGMKPTLLHGLTGSVAHGSNMGNRLFTRRLAFSRAPLKGYHRFGDIFRLTPAPDNWLRPPTIMGDYPLILELSYDPKIAPDREIDFWRRDLFERDREKKLGTDGWTDPQIDARRNETKMSRKNGGFTQHVTFGHRLSASMRSMPLACL